jgi:TonB family protein
MRSFARRRAPVLAAFAALAVLAAPAAAQAPGAAPSDTLPPVSLHLDSAAAVRALAAVPAPELPQGISPLFSLDFDTTGAVDTVYGIFHQLPAAFTDTVVAILRAHARRQAPSPDPPSVDFRVATGPGAAISATRVMIAVPQMTNRSEIGSWLDRVLAGDPEAVGESLTVRLEFRILANGRVEQGSARVLPSTGDEGLNREMVGLAHQLRFRPAEVEGVPVHWSAVLPVTLQSIESGREYRVKKVMSPSNYEVLSALADTAALKRALAALPPLDGPGGTTFRVRLGPGGAVTAVEPVSDALDAARAQALAEAIQPHLRTQPPAPEPREFYLHVEPGPGAWVSRTIGPSSPTLDSSREPLRALKEAFRRHGSPGARTRLLFAVRADGTAAPESIELVGSAPPFLVEAVGEIVGRMRFRPAVIHGAPARAWVLIPLWMERR